MASGRNNNAQRKEEKALKTFNYFRQVLCVFHLRNTHSNTHSFQLIQSSSHPSLGRQSLNVYETHLTYNGFKSQNSRFSAVKAQHTLLRWKSAWHVNNSCGTRPDRSVQKSSPQYQSFGSPALGVSCTKRETRVRSHSSGENWWWTCSGGDRINGNCDRLVRLRYAIVACACVWMPGTSIRRNQILDLILSNDKELALRHIKSNRIEDGDGPFGCL